MEKRPEWQELLAKVEEEVSKNNFRCVTVLKERLKDGERDSSDLLDHLVSVYRVIAKRNDVPVTDIDIINIVLDELGVPSVLWDSFARSFFVDGVPRTQTPLCDLFRSRHPEFAHLCEGCPLNIKSENVINELVSRITSVVFEPEKNVVRVFIHSKRYDQPVPFKYTFDKVIRLYETSVEKPDEAGQPVSEIKKIYAVVIEPSLAAADSGYLVPGLSSLTNTDTTPFWRHIIGRMELELGDEEVTDHFLNYISNSVPDDLNVIDSSMVLTDLAVRHLPELTKHNSRPVLVLKKLRGTDSLQLWVYPSEFIKVSKMHGVKVTNRALEELMAQFGGERGKLGIRPFKDLRGIYFPIASFPDELRTRLEELYDRMNDTIRAKLKVEEGEPDEDS